MREEHRRPVEVERVAPCHVALGPRVLERPRFTELPLDGQRMPLQVQRLERRPVDAGRGLPPLGDDDARKAEVALHGRTHHLRETRVLVGTALVVAVVHLQVAAEVEVERNAPAPGVAIVEFADRTAGRRLDPAVALLGSQADGGTQRSELGQVERNLAHRGAVVARLERGRAAELAARLARDEVDRAGQRIAAVERALRAAQDFDALEVDEVEDGTLHLADVHAVDVHAHRRLPEQGWVGGHRPADGDLGRGRVAGRLADLHVGCNRRQVGHVGDAARFELAFGDRRGGDRHVPQLLGAALRRDLDLLHLAFVGARGSRLGLGQGRYGRIHHRNECR